MPSYKVRWEIDSIEGDTPRQAAEQVWTHHLGQSLPVEDPYRACVFEVYDEDRDDANGWVTVDLAEASSHDTYPALSVAVYECNKACGGPEEGGWWYSTGALVSVIDLLDIFQDEPNPKALAVPQWFANDDRENDARNWANRLQEKLDEGPNKGRPDENSVNCRGYYRALIHEGHPPAGFPAERPTYE